MKTALPENFDLNDHLRDYPPGDTWPGQFNTDHARYILSQITLVPARNKAITGKMENGYTPLYSVMLQKIVHDYKNYLKYFVETGVIESNGSYSPSASFVFLSYGKSPGKCTGYRFAKLYKESTTVYSDYSEKFVKKLKKRRKAEYDKLKEEYGHLTKWLWPNCKLVVDVETATRFLKVRRAGQLANPALQDSKKLGKFSLKDLESRGIPQLSDPNEQYKFAINGLTKLDNNDIDCTVDGTVGRMHTNLTNLKSDLRNLITYGAESLVSLDITNSQPYLATVLTNPEFYNKAEKPAGKTLKTLRDHPLNLPKELTNKQSPLMLVKLRELADKEDFKVYRNLVSKTGLESVDLYEYMKEKCSEHGISFANRGEVKEGMFEVLFSRNGYHSKAKKLFKELFPSVDNLFRTIKQEDHRLLPILLQRIESEVVLRVITKKIGKRYPAIPMFTIHDSIATTEQHVNTVEQVMIEELTKLTGLFPKLKKESWNPANLDWAKYTG
jgi:hypothetical protein